MRFLFKDAERVRRLAKTLKSSVALHGVEWPLHRCREVTAEACGYPSFHEAEASAGKAGASEVDEASPVEVARARKRHQRAVLERNGLAPEVADDVLARVGFTNAVRRARGLGPTTGARPVAGPTPRQERIAKRGPVGRSMRAGNFDSFPVVDASGEWIGVSLGSDHCVEHDDAPEGFLEAMGVPEDASTVGDAILRPSTGGGFRLRDERDGGLATVLLLNRPESHIGMDDSLLRPEDFSDDRWHARWKATRRQAPFGLIVAWSYDAVALAGFEGEVRDRVAGFARAVRDGRVSAVPGSFYGPLLVRADRLDPDMPLGQVAKAVASAHRTRMGAGVRHGPLLVDLAPASAPQPT